MTQYRVTPGNHVSRHPEGDIFEITEEGEAQRLLQLGVVEEMSDAEAKKARKPPKTPTIEPIAPVEETPPVVTSDAQKAKGAKA